MIDGVGWAPAAPTPSTPEAGSRQVGGEMGKDEFLQLMVAQLKNQDPLNPMNAEDFAAQLAQFSSLEQLMNINETLGAQGTVISATNEALNSSAALGVLGRTVLAVGDGVQLTGAGDEAVTIGVGGTGGTATLRIFDESGREIASRELGEIPGGRNRIELGPEGESLPPGTYRYAVDVVNGAGEPVEVQTFTQARIDGVRYGPEGPVLTSGGLEIPLGNVIEVGTDD